MIRAHGDGAARQGIAKHGCRLVDEADSFLVGEWNDRLDGEVERASVFGASSVG